MPNSMRFERTVGGMTEAVAALGSDQASATLLSAGVNVVTAATGTTADGLRLPAGLETGDSVHVANQTAVALDVFPDVGGKIDNAAANAARALGANKSARYVYLGKDSANVPRWSALISA